MKDINDSDVEIGERVLFHGQEVTVTDIHDTTYKKLVRAENDYGENVERWVNKTERMQGSDQLAEALRRLEKEWREEFKVEGFTGDQYEG